MTTEILKACIYMLIGAFLCARFMPDKPEKQAQEQSQKCVAKIVKRQNVDGSTDEITEFLAVNSQKQSQVAKPSKKNGLGAFDKELIYKRKLLESDKFDINGMIKLEKEMSKLGIMIEW